MTDEEKIRAAWKDLCGKRVDWDGGQVRWAVPSEPIVTDYDNDICTYQMDVVDFRCRRVKDAFSDKLYTAIDGTLNGTTITVT